MERIKLALSMALIVPALFVLALGGGLDTDRG
jgi:hypothetical protein